MTSHGDQNFFPDARNIVISGGTFTNVSTPSSKRHGFKILLRNISKGAVYNAAERGDPPKCHPHTRIAIRAEIMEWIEAPPAMRKLILWMYGPAGSGKTAIAQSIAEECARLGLLAASFFFWRTAAGRSDASRFIASIAYQLSRYIPQMEEHLVTAIERDPTIFSLSLSTQMRVLVIDPMKLAAPSLSTAMFAIVDGVDECGPDGQSQSELIHLLASLTSELEHLPLIFLIASRPEYEIREAFDENTLKPLTKVLVLDNNYKPDEDIKLYFDSIFHDIYEKHHRLGRRLPSPWPAAGDVDSLVSKASGQFIFAATVTKYMDSPRHNPVERMNVILRLSTSGNDTPFALLDELYRFILDSVTDIEKVLDILAFLLLNHEIDRLNDAEALLGIEFRSTLIDMHSLVCVPPPSDINAKVPTVYHASLEDFLMDESRSRQYYIGKSEGHLRLVRYWLKAIGRFLRVRVPLLRFVRLGDVIEAFEIHAAQSSSSEDLVHDLAHFDLRAVLEAISDFPNNLYLADWQKFFDRVKTLVGSNRPDIVVRLQHDFDTFWLDLIAQHPPLLRVHIPALLCLLHDHHGHDSGDLFQVLRLGTSNSPEERTYFNLDKRLLNLYDFPNEAYKEILKLLPFRVKPRAGEYSVDGKSYVALAKAIVNIIYSKGGERNYQIKFAREGYPLYVHDGWDPVTRTRINDHDFVLMDDVLEKASTDWDLARFSARAIALASVKYIQRCGLLFLKAIPDTPTEPPPYHPSLEDTEDPSLDSESQAHNASDGLSVRHEGYRRGGGRLLL